MENIFIDNPINVNILNVDSFSVSDNKGFRKNIKQQVVWINTDDKKIVNMWKTNNAEKLKKHYGQSIKNILGSTKKGGDEELDIDGITFDEEDMDELLKDNDEVSDNLSKKKEDEVKVEKPFIVVNDIYIFPEDKISEFKKKIYIATGIPPYRQHLWYEVGNKAIPLSYSVYHDSFLRVDIRDIATNSNFYEGIPIDTLWYSAKEELRVNAMDEFKLLDQIYYKHGITEYFIVDLNDFIVPVRGNLEQLIRKDLYSIELIYYSFILKYWPQLSLSTFGEYIKNEDTLFEKYPDLAPDISSVRNMYKQETEIIGSNYYPIMDEKKWDVPFYVSIIYSVISVTEQYILPGSVVHLRNLFDVFTLNDTVNYIVCNVELNNRPVVLTKRYKNTKILSTKVAVNAILFNIKIPEHGNISLIINKKGNYKIESKWREDQYLNFSMVYKQVETFVRPVIEIINTFGKIVSTNPLPIIKNDNSVFTDIDISMFWKFNMSKQKFQNVKDILNNYVNAGIMKKSSASVSLSHDYYFTKGMYKYDMGSYKMLNPVQNQYQYLTDSSIKNRHDMLITRRKRISITHRFSDIKIDFKGLKEQEYITFYVYILRLLESIPRVRGDAENNNMKKLKHLKEKDPALYEFKKIYNSDLVYSKLCQKQKQPVMYNEPGKNRVKFWNFTSNEPAYYGCPNSKYPYINFITNAHPKDFCIPCCYKLPASTNVNDKKTSIYNTCMENKIYEKEKKSLIKSRYVMAYGKTVDVGRLSKLPENTLEPLFYDTFSKNAEGIDTECEKDKGYYLFGVPQTIKNVSNIGFLFSLSHALGKNIIDFTKESISKIKKKPEYWNIMLNGTIPNYFNTLRELIEELESVFVGDKMSAFEHWNELFIDVARIYWDISIIHFIDKLLGTEESSISLKIPGYIQHWEDYVSNRKCLIIIERNNTFYPIYVIYKDVFFNIGAVETKLYNHTDDIIGVVNNLALCKIKKKKYRSDIDLQLIKKFTKNSNYNIEYQFINSSGFCYGITLKYIPNKNATPFYEIKKSDKVKSLDDENYEDLVEIFNKQNIKSKEAPFYIPLKESYYKTDGTHLSFSTPTEKLSPKWKTISLFMQKLNIFIQKYSDREINDSHSKHTLYPLLNIENWLLYDTKSEKDIIGFRCNSHHYLIQPIKKSEASNIHKVKMIKLLYSPYVVNEVLGKKIKPVKDERFNKISHSLYNKYLYPILIIELINVMNKQRNTTMRKKIQDVIKNFNISNMHNNELSIVLKKYPNDYKIIRKLLIDNLTLPISKKKTMLVNLVNKKLFNKTEIYSIIENSIFDFDKKLFEKFKEMDHKELVKELEYIFSKITLDKEPVFNDKFPNMLMSCEINNPYCQNKKLMIKKTKLLDLLDIMASDILNPVKARYIFSPIFVKNTIDYFKFIIRKDEHIMITI